MLQVVAGNGVRLVGNAAGRSRTGSYGGAGCGEQPAKVLLAGGLSPTTRFLGSLRSLGMTIRDLGPGSQVAVYQRYPENKSVEFADLFSG